jgi:ABC-2 type transport system permease protein
MNLWQLEWARLLRSRRLVALVGVYLFFGLLGPVTARYMGEILERFGGDVVVQFPDPVPADGIAQFTANANQIGLLVAVIVAAGSLVIDAIPEMSIFLRTRINRISRLLRPRLVVSFAAVASAFVIGLLGAWYETAVLLGALPLGDLALGALLTLIYLAFVVALVAAVGSRLASVLGTVATTVVVLLVLPIVGLVEPVGRWLPSHLPGAMDSLLRNTSGRSEYMPAALATLVLAPTLVRLATRWAAFREL